MSFLAPEFILTIGRVARVIFFVALAAGLAFLLPASCVDRSVWDTPFAQLTPRRAFGELVKMLSLFVGMAVALWVIAPWFNAPEKERNYGAWAWVGLLEFVLGSLAWGWWRSRFLF